MGKQNVFAKRLFAERNRCVNGNSGELFEIQDNHRFERNPMVYAECANLNIYIARNFAPLAPTLPRL